MLLSTVYNFLVNNMFTLTFFIFIFTIVCEIFDVKYHVEKHVSQEYKEKSNLWSFFTMIISPIFWISFLLVQIVLNYF
jgi:hypothetical protein